MTELSSFLDCYKYLEENLADCTGMSVLDYENSLNRSPEGEKLQVCRIIRNYAAHHQDGSAFLAYPQMIAFLEEENRKFLSIHTPVKNVAVKCDPVTGKTTCKQAVAMMAKSKEGYLPIVNSEKINNISGILTESMLISALCKCTRVTDKILPLLTKAELSRSRKLANFSYAGDTLSRYPVNSPVLLVDSHQNYLGKVVRWDKLNRKRG